MESQIELMVFDLDGTLIDSKKDIAVAVNWALEQSGIAPVSDELIEQYVGTGVQPLIQKMLTSFGIGNFDKAFSDFKYHYANNLTVHTQLFPNVLQVLEHYKALPKVILTNKTNEFIQPILQQLNIEKYFEKFYGRQSFPTQKPHHGPLIAISQEFGVPVQKVLMIGDTKIDILAGQGAGTKTCAVFFGYGSRSELLELQPDYTVEKPLELMGLI